MYMTKYQEIAQHMTYLKHKLQWTKYILVFFLPQAVNVLLLVNNVIDSIYHRITKKEKVNEYKGEETFRIDSVS